MKINNGNAKSMKINMKKSKNVKKVRIMIISNDNTRLKNLIQIKLF